MVGDPVGAAAQQARVDVGDGRGVGERAGPVAVDEQGGAVPQLPADLLGLAEPVRLVGFVVVDRRVVGQGDGPAGVGGVLADGARSGGGE
jgi:hypothetical protein